MTAVRQPTTSARRAPFPRAPARGLQPAPGLPRRVLNVAVAAVGLVVAAPLMAAIACAIKLTSRGPVFYSQLRIGLDQRAPGRPTGNTRRLADYGGRPFRIHQFRTIAPGCRRPHEPVEILAPPQDLHRTPLGRSFLRYRL